MHVLLLYPLILKISYQCYWKRAYHPENGVHACYRGACLLAWRIVKEVQVTKYVRGFRVAQEVLHQPGVCKTSPGYTSYLF